MERGDRKQCFAAGGDTLPPDHKATLLLLEPGTCPLGLEPRHHFFERSAPRVLRLPDALWALRPAPALPELLPQRCGLIPCSGRDALEALAGATPLASADRHGSKPRPHWCPLVPMGRWGPVGQGQPAPRGEAVDEAPLALPPVGDALAATLPRGNKRHPRRQTPHEASRVPRPFPESGRASRPACHPRASAGTSAAWHSATPIAAHAGHRTSDSR